MQRCSEDPNSSSAEPGAVVLSVAQFIEAFGFPFKIIAILPWGQLKVKTIASAAEIEAALKWAEHENKAGANIYFEPNQSRRPHHKSGDDDIVYLRSIKADIDAKDGRTVEDCLAVVNGLTRAPSIVVFSGGGFQVHYLTQGKVGVSHVALYRAAGLGLQKLTGGDSVSEPSRAMRFPGFINHPYQPSKRGRGPKLAEVVSATLRRYTLEELAEAFGAGGSLKRRLCGQGGRKGQQGQESPRGISGLCRTMMTCQAVRSRRDGSISCRQRTKTPALLKCSQCGT